MGKRPPFHYRANCTTGYYILLYSSRWPTQPLITVHDYVALDYLSLA